MKQMVKWLLGAQLICVGTMWAGYYHVLTVPQYIEKSYPLYIDCVQTPDGWEVTEYSKRKLGYYAQCDLRASIAGLICGIAMGGIWACSDNIRAAQQPPSITSTFLATAIVCTAMGSGVWMVTLLEELNNHKPSYKPSTFEKDQAIGGYEYYVQSEKKFKTEQEMKSKYPEFSYKYLPTV